MDKIYLDLLKIIFNKLDFLSEIRFRQVNKFCYKNLHIINLCNINYKFLKLLNDDILKNYHYIQYLDAINNKKIKFICANNKDEINKMMKEFIEYANALSDKYYNEMLGKFSELIDDKLTYKNKMHTSYNYKYLNLYLYKIMYF